MTGNNHKRAKRPRCPYCKIGELKNLEKSYLYCSRCDSIYHHSSASSALKRLNVEPVSDLPAYPEIIAKDILRCDCKWHEAIEHPEWGLFGPHYCPKHNVIVLETFFLEDEDQKSIPELTIQIINHETLHWILCKDFGESVSAGFDEITDDTTSEEVS